jgi:glutathione S-transferase
MDHTNRLITIPISHYCEKARWALEWCEIPYMEERHLQGFHYPHSFLAARSATLPVLKTSEGVYSDSTDILTWCDAKAAEKKKLYPRELALKKSVEDFEHYLDEEFGVAGRLWMYTFMLQEIPTILRYSKMHGVPKYELKLFPFVFPLVKGLINKVLKNTPTSRDDTLAIVNRTFDRVGEMLADGRPYLFGDHFTAADLTFASLAAALLLPENYGVKLPSVGELPSAMATQIIAWRMHPAGEFALKMYQQHRG